jgi:NDP-sugar pyrophosphorylase family protein
MILAAGFGTRLRPITNTLPKPLVPVRNKPLIAYAVENYLRAGVDEIVVNLHHLPDLIERYLTETFDCTFHFSREEKILGTGGALKRVRHLLTDEFFLVNGDTIQSPPFDEMRRARCDAVATLALRHPPPHDKFTPVSLDDNGRVTFGSGDLMFSGAHAIGPEIFDSMPDEDEFSIVDSVYKRVPVAGVVDDGPWFDIGTPQRYLEANGGTTIGARSVVEGTLQNTAVWDDCHIGRGVVLTDCIVAHGVDLSGGIELSRSMICRGEEGLVIASF